MAHEIETMAYANETPWHGLGANVSDDLTPEQFEIAAGLNWTVEQKPLLVDLGDGQTEPVDSRVALVRSTDKKVLTITSPGWVPLQNRDVLAFMENYVKAGGAKLETAGSLRGGRMIWGLARLGHDFEVSKGDRVNGYLLFTSPHEVGKAISIRTTTVRVVCANTLAMAHSGGDVHYSQNHLSAFNVDAAKERVGIAHEQLAQAERNAKILASLKISADDAVEKILLPVFSPKFDAAEINPKTGKVKELPLSIRHILDSVNNAPGAVPGTGWGVLNGVTHYSDHVSGGKNNADTRLASAWTGDAARKKNLVEEMLLELAA